MADAVIGQLTAGRARQRRFGLRRAMRRKSMTAFLMTLPLILLIVVLVVYPALYSLNLATLKRLMAMVQTVRAGNPFVAVNAYRLNAIAWLLLGQQLLSVVIGLIGKAVSSPAHPLHLDAGFSPGGWLAVIMTFVLARVFAEGTLMREDLEGTV